MTKIREKYRTYCMNLLQDKPEKKFGPVLVTLNPPSEISPSKVVGRYAYEHPLFTAKVQLFS